MITMMLLTVALLFLVAEDGLINGERSSGFDSSEEFDFTVDLTTGNQQNKTDSVTWESDLVSSGACAKRGVLKLSFGKPGSPTSRRVAQITLWLTSSRGWSFNIGDAATNRGSGGDFRRQTGRDAEVSGFGRTLNIFGSDFDGPRWSRTTRNVVDGKIVFVIGNGLVSWNKVEEEFHFYNGSQFFALNGQPDIGNNTPNFDVYLGLNRVILNEFRSGRGLCAAAVTWL